MESPRSVSRFLLTALVIGTVTAVTLCICCRDYDALLFWLACLGIFLVVCVVLGIANLAMFGPIFWLMSRIAPGKSDHRPAEYDDESARTDTRSATDRHTEIKR
jgi:hypothetical protein